MGSQPDQTADDIELEDLYSEDCDAPPKVLYIGDYGAATKGCCQKCRSCKIRFVYFLAVFLILLIVIIALAVALSYHNYGLKEYLCGDIEQESSVSVIDRYSELKKYLCTSIVVSAAHITSPNISVIDRYSELKKYLCGDIEQESSGCTACPGGWLGHNESCYYISSGKESWKGSRETCVRMGANLLIIEDRAEQEFIDRFYKGRAGVFWIGLHGDGGRGEDGQHLSQPSGESSADCPGLYSGVGFYKDKCTKTNSWICEKKTLKI